MNHYTQLLLFIKELAETHPLVNTVTHGNVDNLDLDKSNIFPLVHISISDAQFSNGQTLTFPITIECLSERDFNKEIITNKFWGQDNEVDNHNETLAILNFMWTSIYRDWNDNNLTTSENATAEKIEFAKGNILDGWSLSFDVEVPNTELCLDLITTLTYNLTLSSGANGTATSSVGEEGVIVVNSGTNVAAYADPDPGYRFSQWLRNTIPISLNPYAFIMNQDITLTAEFIVSLIKQLSISVSGTGTTNPIPGNYDREQGTFQLIQAIETDTDYIFDEFTQDGTPLVGNPVNVEITDNTLVVAYFIVKWLQWVFNNAPQKIVDKYYFVDRSPNASNVQIKNTQVGNFNGTVYIAYDMTGRTIASYESDGAAIPTRTSDIRISVTAGLLYSITLDNGQKCTLNEGSEDVIFFTDGTTTTSGTLESVVLATFWNTKSEFGTPGNTINGYNKYLVNQIAGTAAHLASVDQSNLSVDEKIANGGFDTDTIWSKGAGWTISGGKAIYSGGGFGIIQQLSGFTTLPTGSILIVFEGVPINSLRVKTTSTAYVTYVGNPIILNCLSTDDFVIQSLLTSSEIDNISVKEVTAISLLSAFKFKLKPTVCDMYWLNSSDITAGNGYMVRTTPIAITLYRVDAGALTQLDTAVITYVNYQDIEPVFGVSGITVDVNGIEILTSADTTYNTFKLIVLDNDVTDEFSHFENGGLKYDLSNFIKGTGTYGVQKTPGNTTLLDCKGNTLLIPANVVSNEGNTHRGIKYGALDATDATYEEVYAIVDDASTTITKTAEEIAGYVSELKIL